MTSMQSDKIVVVDDEEHILHSLETVFMGAGYRNITLFSDSREVMPFFEKNRVSVAVVDLRMPHLPGFELLKKICSHYPDCPVIILTASTDVELAINCMKEGAFDFLLKPVSRERLVTTMKKALERVNMINEIFSLKKSVLSGELEKPDAFTEIVTQNDKMLGIFRYIEAIARSDESILICGETGVGKNLLASIIHTVSKRTGEFVRVDVAALDDNMFSSALFGHRKGAFTGATENRQGHILNAETGTLFLDEIGELTEESQLKLLTLVDQHTYLPLGIDRPRTTTARIIGVTNKNLEKAVETGSFRRDLFYRLRVHRIEVPPLRERLDDLPFLLEHFVRKAAGLFEKPMPSIPSEILSILEDYDFPGNVRELEGIIKNSVAISDQGLDVESIISHIKKVNNTVEHFSGNGETIMDTFKKMPTMAEAEELLVKKALKLTDGNQTLAASMLKISRNRLRRKITQLKE